MKQRMHRNLCLSGLVITGLMGIAILGSQVAYAKQYLYVNCAPVSGGSSSGLGNVYSGYVISDEGPEFHESHISIRGKKPVISTLLIDNPVCKTTYTKTEQVWNGYTHDWDWADVKKQRNWNAFAVKESGAASYMGCSVSSYIETFDSQEDFLRDMYRRRNWATMKSFLLEDSPTSEGGIGDPACIVNQLSP
jgi:hypothetical protein